MAVTSSFYGLAIRNQWDPDSLTSNGQGDFGATADDYRTSLHTAYTPNVDTHEDWADTGATETTGTGYTAQGYDHATLTLSYDAGTNEIRHDADDAAWTSSSFSADQAVFYNWQAAVAANAGLHSYVDFGGTETVSSGTFTVQWHADGITKITVT